METATTMPAEGRSAWRTRVTFFVFGLFAGALFAIVFVIFLANYTIPRTWTYTGEGYIHPIGIPIVTPGYQVEFTAFDMSKPFTGKFTVSELPAGRSVAYFHLHIVSPEEYAIYGKAGAGDHPFPRKSPPAPSGNLSLRLRRETGETVFDEHAPLGEFMATEYGRPRGGLYDFELFSRDLSMEVAPKTVPRNEKLTFEVEYEPGDSPVHGFAVPEIRNGGSI